MSFGHSAFLTPHSGTTVLEYPLSIEAIIQFILVSHPSTVRVPGTEYSQTFRDERSRISPRRPRICGVHIITPHAPPNLCNLFCTLFFAPTHPPVLSIFACRNNNKERGYVWGYVYYYTRTSTWIVTGSGSRQGWVKARRARQG